MSRLRWPPYLGELEEAGVGHQHGGQQQGGHHHHGGGLAAGHSGLRHRNRLWIAFALLASFMVVEGLAAWWTGSLALLSDAGHLATDVLGIGMALAAIHAAARAARAGTSTAPHRTFGLYRLEVLAALGNAVLLFGVAGFVLFEAARRLGDPPEILAGPMLLVAAGALVANLIALSLLRAGASESLNVRGAYLEVLGDLLSSVGVLIAAVIILLTDWWYADPLLAVAVALFIIPRTALLARAAIRVLVQAAPRHLPVAEVSAALGQVPGVRDVHDLHVWTLTSGMDVASAHLTIADADQLGQVLADARTALREKYGIEHATLQVEPAQDSDCQPEW
ncbi:cation transporter [Natronosporangium hydrolyticum]|uniref:Cation transporter n=1 Tax=Natronosporangium hydrolyticum TaxID=2811111 RepID=A0A895YHX2_9ACTN|nr:cation diffusion facilitator family transporter [Natronosporangium hydrolyticum]QSB13338.1 cation transporter [Natronosporangium hydrolyticum]